MSTICQVIDYGGPTAGSFIPAIASLSRAITARGDRFVVFASEVPGASWPDDLTSAGAEVRLVGGERDVVTGLKRLRPQVIHSHFNRFDLQTALAGNGARVFWHVHSHREHISTLARAKAFAKYGIVGGARVEAVVTVSEAMRTECIEWFAPPKRVRVLYNGIDTAHFRPPTAEERENAREAFGIAPGDRVVLFFERVAYKGGAIVKAALEALPHYRLLVAGGAQEARDRFGRPPSVIAIDRASDARQLYWAADVLAFASVREAFGLVLVEALACGLPIAATDIPVVREICDGVENVALFQAGDPRALAKAIERAADASNSGGGRARATDRFSLERWTTETLKLYDLG